MYFSNIGKMIGLPNQFLTNEEGSKGGGVIQVGYYTQLSYQEHLYLIDYFSIR